MERELVLRLASALWRLRRATCIETALFESATENSLQREPRPSREHVDLAQRRLGRQRALAFVIFAALIFLTWDLQPVPVDLHRQLGPKFPTVNLSMLYTAKGASAFLVPLANVIKAHTGSWHMVFVVTAIMNLVVVALALFVLKPMRSKAATGQAKLAPAT